MKTTTVYPKSIKQATEFDVLKKGSSNKKLGFKVTAKKWASKRLYSLTLTERETCPVSCHHWEDCYGNNMPFAHRFSTDGLTDKIESEIATLLEKHPQGIVIRLHVLGDFYSVEYVRFWERMLKENPTLCIFGYTANMFDQVTGEGAGIGGAIHLLNHRYADRCTIRFSRNQESNHLSPCFAAEESFEGKAFTCPEQTGKLPSCAVCGLCWTAQKTVRFLSH